VRARPLLLVLLVLPALAGVPPTALAAPVPVPAGLPGAPVSFAGTIKGSDGRAVNALIGLDLHDEQGRQIDSRGCVESPACPVEGYAMNIRVNRDLGAEGSPDTRHWDTTWAVQVPPNTASIYLEVYPQATGFGGTDESRYGSAMRHKVPVPFKGPVHLRLPLDRCDLGGTTGTIAGVATKGGRRVALTRAIAWSLQPDNNDARPILGWNVEPGRDDGSYVLPNLASGQKYQVWLTTSAGQVRKTFKVPVRPCATTRLDVRF
jgi:hypothetical protein